MTLVAFARQSAGTDPQYSGERLLNWYAQPFPDGGRGAMILRPSPGLSPFVTLSAGQPVRALLTMDADVYALSGGLLWKISAGIATGLGAVPDDPKATMATNGLQVAIAADGDYYVWNGVTLTQPDTGAFSDVGSVASLDGYILLFEQYGHRFSITSLNDAETIDALDFASAEGSPDGIVRGHVDHSEVWLFGAKSVEVWGNTGAADFPFEPYQGGYVQRGCAFPASVASEDNGVFFVGDDRVVYRAGLGGSPQRVSTAWVEKVLRDYIDGTDVSAFTFTLDGQKAYCIRLPDRPALVFDIASGLWHERNSGLEEGPWAATCVTRSGGQQYVGATDGKVHTFGGVTDGGETIMREAVSMPISRGIDYIKLHEVAVQFQTGITDLGRVAQASLEHSTDGKVWSSPRLRPIGLLGEYARLARWHGFGRGRQHRIRLRLTDAIDAAVYGVSYRAT